MTRSTLIEVVCLDMTCFKVDPVTLEPVTSCYYEPAVWNDPRGPQLSHGEWLAKRMTRATPSGTEMKTAPKRRSGAVELLTEPLTMTSGHNRGNQYARPDRFCQWLRTPSEIKSLRWAARKETPCATA